MRPSCGDLHSRYIFTDVGHICVRECSDHTRFSLPESIQLIHSILYTTVLAEQDNFEIAKYYLSAFPSSTRQLYVRVFVMYCSINWDTNPYTLTLPS